MSAAGDLYAVLGVSRRASMAQIREAFRALALAHHPDRNPGDEAGATARFRAIADAYAVLGDARSRAAYDRGRAAEGGPGFAPSAASDPERFWTEVRRTVEVIDAAAAQRQRNMITAIALAAFMALIFLVTLAQLQGAVLERPL